MPKINIELSTLDWTTPMSEVIVESSVDDSGDFLYFHRQPEIIILLFNNRKEFCRKDDYLFFSEYNIYDLFS